MFVVILIVLLIDLLTFKGLMILLRQRKERSLKIFIYTLHWLVPVSLFISLYISYRLGNMERSAESVYRYFVLGGLFLLFYLPKLVFIFFHVIEDLVKAIRYLFLKILKPTKKKAEKEGHIPFSRRNFITTTGLAAASLPFFSLLYGTACGRFNFTVHRLQLSFPNLPPAFSGIKLVQISDLHISSFYGHADQLKRVVEMVNQLEADLLVFTGDMVNTFAEEMDDFFPTLKNLQSKSGKFSILGNHDYGDYHSWKNQDDKAENFNKILEHEKRLGFNLLRNESVLMKRDNDTIAMIGVENWGKPPFAQYGNYTKAVEKVKNQSFKILLSHDPTHWDAIISKQTDVNLTLSGHTHGMQFGIEKGNLKWSPAQYRYPHWAGLYKQKKQLLYVNRGLGCIGYPGRIGMPPEITLIELFRS